MSFNPGGLRLTGLDFWKAKGNQVSADWNNFGKYSTELYADKALQMLRRHDKSKPFFMYLAYQAVHNPMQFGKYILQVPEKYIDACRRIKRRFRRLFCGMVNAMDQSIGRVVKYLKESGQFDNTIIVFTSDNGGDTEWGGNNWPLRGNKDTLWEGGTKVVSFVHAPKRITEGGKRTKLFSVVDWYATVLNMAGLTIDQYGDGYNYWPMLLNNSNVFARKRFVYNVDKGSAAIREGRYKLIMGNPGRPSGWFPPTVPGKEGPKLTQTVWLFDIKTDPNERRDLSRARPKLVRSLIAKYRAIAATGVRSLHRPADPRGHPTNFNGTFATGWC